MDGAAPQTTAPAAPADATPPTQVPAAAAELLQSANAVLPTTVDEPAAKRTKVDEGSHVSFAQSVAQQVKDPEVLQSILQYVAQNMEQNVALENEMAKLNEAKALLEKKDEKTKENSRAMVQEAVDVITSLYKSYAPATKVSDAARESFTDLLVNNAHTKPELIDFLRPMAVAASSLLAQHQQQQISAKESEVKAAMEKIAALQNQMGAARKLGASVPAPNWQAAPAPIAVAPPPMNMNAWQTAPIVDVAASANVNGYKPLPAVLAGLARYGESRDRMMPSDFVNNGKIAAMPNRPPQ